MPAYYKDILKNFIDTSPEEIAGQLSQRIIENYSGNYQEQLKSWKTQIALLQDAASALAKQHPKVNQWAIILEYPLLRLQRRLDSVALAGQIVAVIEFKVGAERYEANDARQVEDYALDLRDFHSGSQKLTIVPILCSTNAHPHPIPQNGQWGTVWPVFYTNVDTLSHALIQFAEIQDREAHTQLDLETWGDAPYTPVPSIIEAAELLYSGHQVEEIAHSATESENLKATSDRLIQIAKYAQENKKKIVCFVTGIPGSGKTLIGLNLVHDKRIKHDLNSNAAYLSGNTPLVEVLREALARDRKRRTGEPLRETRRTVRTEIQHLMDYVREYIAEHPTHIPPEHIIVFDEAQRAWNAAYGKQKFDRAASEPMLFLEIMNRRNDWAVIVALVGGGQEINIGEGGLREWGDALSEWAKNHSESDWMIYAAPDVVFGGESTVGRALFDQAYSYSGKLETDRQLHLGVSVRSFRCEAISRWVSLTLDGHIGEAKRLADETAEFPIHLTRNLAEMRAALTSEARGSRHVGLVASSGARRLRADGLGVTLSASDRDAYVHWYLEPKGDIRSSNALEVTANEYTCQGLELDYVGICWGGDMLWSPENHFWQFKELHGAKWKSVHKIDTQNYIKNTYRVLMTRSRRGMIIWIPEGDVTDSTYQPSSLDATAQLLLAAGARPLHSTMKVLRSEDSAAEIILGKRS